jgi:putative phage-type endonuclease
MLTIEQIEARKGRIGGSDCASALGLNPYKSRHRLWMEKTGKIEPIDLSDNEKVYWGEVMEKHILKEYWRRNPNNILLVECETEIHSEYDFMVANYDAIGIDDNGQRYIIEVKNVGFMMAKDWEDVETLPAHYEAQVRHYLAVSGYSYGVIVALIGGQQYKEFRIDRDLELEKALIEGEKEFIEYVRTDTEPDILFYDNQKDVSDAIKEYNHKLELDDQPIDIDNPELLEIPAKIKELQGQAKELDKQIKYQQNLLKQAMSTSIYANVGKYFVSYKPQESNRLDSKAIRELYPQVAEQCTKTSISQVLRIKENKE